MIILLSKRNLIKISIFACITTIILILCVAKSLGWPTMMTVLSSELPDELRDYWIGSNDIIWNVNTSDKLIALTFDDGPSPHFTPQVLNILAQNDVKATFFLIGREADKLPDITRKIVENGNEIGNHTYFHPTTLKNININKVKNEITKTEDAIYQITNIRPVLFRPPGGYFNKEIVESAKELNYTTILWSWNQQTNDWKNPGVEKIVETVLKNPRSGDIIIFHDRGGDRTQTIESLQPIIDGLKEKGFKIVTVSELIKNKKTKIGYLEPLSN